MWHLTFGAVVILIGLAINFAGLVLGYLELRQRQGKISDKQDEIHVLVDGRFSEAVERIAQLSGTLKDAHVPVPDMPKGGPDTDPPLTPTPEPTLP